MLLVDVTIIVRHDVHAVADRNKYFINGITRWKSNIGLIRRYIEMFLNSLRCGF
jgi:hypothetical protein